VSSHFHDLVRALAAGGNQFVLIGVAGANYYAPGASALFATRDRDLFLPPDPANLLRVWQACESCDLELTVAGEPLDQPRNLWLAEQVVARRALTRATDGSDLEVDLTLVMAGYEFEDAWNSRRVFEVDGIALPVADLSQIVTSKAAAGRPKDRLFLESTRKPCASYCAPITRIEPPASARLWLPVAARPADSPSRRQSRNSLR
jgi:hypothetical protein